MDEIKEKQLLKFLVRVLSQEQVQHCLDVCISLYVSRGWVCAVRAIGQEQVQHYLNASPYKSWEDIATRILFCEEDIALKEDWEYFMPHQGNTVSVG